MSPTPEKHFFGAAAGVFLSRLTGLVRSQVVAAVFGATLATDAFYLAYRFPNALRELFADGALSAAFTKTLAVVNAQGGPPARRELVASVLAVFGTVTLAIALLGALEARPIIAFMSSPQFEAQGGHLLGARLFQLLVFYLPLAMISALAMAQLALAGKGFRAMVASAFFNLGSVAGALLLAPLCVALGVAPIGGLAIGTLLGGVAQFLYQAWPLIVAGDFPTPKIFSKRVWCNPHVGQILRLMGPRVVGQGAMTFALLINTHYATAVGVKTLSLLTLAQTLIQLPVGLFGVAAGFAALPQLSVWAAQGDMVSFEKSLWTTLSQACWLALLTVGGFSVLAGPLSILLFSYGKFTAPDGVALGVAVCAYSAGTFFSVGSKVLVQGYYALDKTRQMIANALVFLSLTAVVTPLLATHYGLVGLGASSGLCAGVEFCLNLFFLNRHISKRGGYFLRAPEKRWIWGTSLGAVGFAVCGVIFHQQVVAPLGRGWPHGLWVAVALGGGLLAGLLCLGATLFWGPKGLCDLILSYGAKAKKFIK